MEDEPVHKPRQARGTPAYKYGFKASFYFVCGCFAISSIILNFNKDRLYRRIAAGYYDASKFMQQKRKLMSNRTPIPNIHNAPAREWDEQLSLIKYDASDPSDADL